MIQSGCGVSGGFALSSDLPRDRFEITRDADSWIVRTRRRELNYRLPFSFYLKRIQEVKLSWHLILCRHSSQKTYSTTIRTWADRSGRNGTLASK